jgi:hypothetical protein
MLEIFLIVTLFILTIFLIYKNIKLEQKVGDLEFERFMQLDLERIKTSQEVNEITTSERTLQ